MSPREYLRLMHHRAPALGGSTERPLDVSAGTTVGVVLLGPGGPQSKQEIRNFLYRGLMDPAAGALPGSGWVRHASSLALAWSRAASVEREYEAVGGRAPVVRHALEQARALQSYLDRQESPVRFKVYPAMRHGEPSTEEALDRLADDGIDHAVLIPIFPQYSVSRTGSSLLYWEAASRRARRVPTVTAVRDYAEDPLLVRALNERIDETLQRFPRDQRAAVRYVFVAHGGSPMDAQRSDRPYCCQVHRTVDAVMRQRNFDRPFEVAFQRAPGITDPSGQALEDVLSRLGDAGERNVLVLPISTVTEQLDIAYRLDVSMRRVADSAGISRYEVAAPLNCHPLLIEALGRVVRGRVLVEGTRLGPEPVAPSEVCPRAAWDASGDSAAVCRHCSHSAGPQGSIPAPALESSAA